MHSFIFASLYKPGGGEKRVVVPFWLCPYLHRCVPIKAFGNHKKSYVPLTSGTMSVLRGVMKEFVSSTKAGRAPSVITGFLYSTMENNGCFKEQVREV